MLFNDFIHKKKLKNKTTLNIKFQQSLSSLSLNDVGNYLRDGTFKTDVGIVILHVSKGTHQVKYIHECYFDSYGCSLPQKLSTFIVKQNGHCLYSEHKIQGLTSRGNSFCAAYFLYISYLTKDVGIDFNSAVLNLYYQMI